MVAARICANLRVTGRLDDKVVLVTGGASGIGLATATRMAKEGAQVLIADINAEGASQVAATISGRSVVADVGDPADWDRIVATAVDDMGGLDIAFLNAGLLCGEMDITALTDETYRRLTGANIDGVFFGVRAVSAAMAPRGGGSIVATASMAGLISFSPDPLYTMTKHAVVGLVRSLAPHLMAKGIKLNCVCPGIVDTPMLPAEAKSALAAAGFGIIHPNEIAEAVIDCALGTASGQCVVCQSDKEPESFVFGVIPGLGI